MPSKTKNDVAWEDVFSEYDVVRSIEKKGFFEITASTLKEFREPRLMASIDHEVNKPQVFKDHKLSILPATRNSYVIGNFNTHMNVNYTDIKPSFKKMSSNLLTINPNDIYSESAAIHCAFNSGIIDDLFGGEKFCHTISGKMSSGEFDFSITNILNNSKQTINIKNTGCEIDGGFESEKKIVLLEAKNMSVDDFVIRQLYFPYRLWVNKGISKEVVPVFMTHSNDVFSFFIYKFNELKNYNSLEFVSQKNFAFISEKIRLEDIDSVFAKVTLQKEPDEIPFPQADKFSRVIDLLGLLFESPLSRDDITTHYDFDARQTDYYTDAARYLGLIERYKDEKSKEIMFSLTSSAKHILSLEHKPKILGLIGATLAQPVFYETYKHLKSNKALPAEPELASIICKYRVEVSAETAKRRAQTVKQWINWVLSQVTD